MELELGLQQMDKLKEWERGYVIIMKVDFLSLPPLRFAEDFASVHPNPQLLEFYMKNSCMSLMQAAHEL